MRRVVAHLRAFACRRPPLDSLGLDPHATMARSAWHGALCVADRSCRSPVETQAAAIAELTRDMAEARALLDFLRDDSVCL